MKTVNIKKLEDYRSFQPQWEKYSAIRTRPRRLIEEFDSGAGYFPLSRQPILAHHKIANIDENAVKYVLAQSLCKYMNDIANIETDIINKAAYGIMKDKYVVQFTQDLKRDALSIIIDESYHAYVALDFMQQVADCEKIKILDLPKESALSSAINKIQEMLPERLIKHFELISVCIAEHALTNDLIAVAKSKDVNKIFYYVMHDHVLDENRHAKYFENILSIFWSQLEENDKAELAPFIPLLISLYSDPDIQAKFDFSILRGIGLSEEDAKEIVEETHFGWSESKIDKENIIVKQMLGLLERTDFFLNPIGRDSFAKYGIEL